MSKFEELVEVLYQEGVIDGYGGEIRTPGWTGLNRTRARVDDLEKTMEKLLAHLGLKVVPEHEHLEPMKIVKVEKEGG